jgi:A/G-specific adenine glycosylase
MASIIALTLAHWIFRAGKQMEQPDIEAFREKVCNFYHEHGRHDLPWRHNVSPYSILVSEVMLQQTQVARVVGKYHEWLAQFPGMQSLAEASGAEVLGAWQGLGYNSRGLRLREAARRVMADYDGQLPDDSAELVKLPGIGPNTAGSIAAFAFERPVVFIETNIRRVYIHEFFAGSTDVTSAGDSVTSLTDRRISDAQLKPLLEATLDREHPREWYWALMDYGSWLARQVPNPNRRSKHYARQSAFEGSARQIRGEVLRRLLAGPRRAGELGITDERLEQVLAGLAKDGLIEQQGGTWHLVS